MRDRFSIARLVKRYLSASLAPDFLQSQVHLLIMLPCVHRPQLHLMFLAVCDQGHFGIAEGQGASTCPRLDAGRDLMLGQASIQKSQRGFECDGRGRVMPFAHHTGHSKTTNWFSGGCFLSAMQDLGPLTHLSISFSTSKNR